MKRFQVEAEIGGALNVIFVEAENEPGAVEAVWRDYGLSTVIRRIVEADEDGNLV